MKLLKLKCKRCGHIWIPRKEEIPQRCGKCKSPYWNKELIKIQYLNIEDIIKANKKVLERIIIKKADSHKILDYSKLKKIINNHKKLVGDIYDKAVCLLKDITKEHIFASGNRRTAFLCMKGFLRKNNKKTKIKNHNGYFKALQGIRENYYSNKEIKEWIKNGIIRRFNR